MIPTQSFFLPQIKNRVTISCNPGKCIQIAKTSISRLQTMAKVSESGDKWLEKEFGQAANTCL